MGKLNGFAWRQKGAGFDLYDDGVNPNQEGGAVTTRRGCAAKAKNNPLPREVKFQLALSDNEDDEELPQNVPLRKDAIIYDADNDIQKFMTKMGLNRKGAKRTHPHNHVLGWNMHGPYAGSIKKTRKARLIRQAIALAIGQYKKGYKNLDHQRTNAAAKARDGFHQTINELGYNQRGGSTALLTLATTILPTLLDKLLG